MSKHLLCCARTTGSACRGICSYAAGWPSMLAARSVRLSVGRGNAVQHCCKGGTQAWLQNLRLGTADHGSSRQQQQQRVLPSAPLTDTNLPRRRQCLSVSACLLHSMRDRRCGGKQLTKVRPLRNASTVCSLIHCIATQLRKAV